VQSNLSIYQSFDRSLTNQPTNHLFINPFIHSSIHTDTIYRSCINHYSLLTTHSLIHLLTYLLDIKSLGLGGLCITSGLLLILIRFPLGIIDRPCDLRLGVNNGTHKPSLTLGLILQGTDVTHIFGHPFDQLKSELVMLHLSTLELDGTLDAIPLFEEFGGTLDPDSVVMDVNLVGHLDLLELTGLGILLDLLGLLLLLVAELGIINELDDGRVGGGIDEDDVEPPEFLGLGDGIGLGHDAEGLVLLLLGVGGGIVDGSTDAELVKFNLLVHRGFHLDGSHGAPGTASSHGIEGSGCGCG